MPLFFGSLDYNWFCTLPSELAENLDNKAAADKLRAAFRKKSGIFSQVSVFPKETPGDITVGIEYRMPPGEELKEMIRKFPLFGKSIDDKIREVIEETFPGPGKQIIKVRTKSGLGFKTR